MTEREYVYWLQGFYELSGDLPNGLTKEQSDLIKKHLQLVFKHSIDPSAGDSKVQAALNAIHNGPDKPGLIRC